MICWILTDDKAGTRHQCIGLSARLGENLEQRLFTSRPRWPWSWLPARAWPWPLRSQAVGGAVLLAPWPDLLIVAGRGAVALGPAIKKALGGRACLVAVQNPRLPLAAFDLVIAPAHDGVHAPNVLTIQGALTGVTPAALAKGRGDFPALAGIPSPRVAVLIGGGNRHFRLDAAEAGRIGQQLRCLIEQGASLLVTTSRRTSLAASAALRAALGGKAALFWDGRLDDPGNPYRGILGWADHFLVTPDSISMACEAACCGRPVQIFDLPRLRACSKFARFHQHMRERQHCRPFTGSLENWSIPSFDETGRAAAAIQRLLKPAITP